MRVVVCSAMHGRHESVKYCLEKLRELDVFLLYGYTTEEDGEFLNDYVDCKYKVQNNPLWIKFQMGMEILRSMHFDIAIMIGSDDYFDKAYLDFVIEKCKTNDFIGFKDIYFKKGNKSYYWQGYSNHRKGEPCGAGKVYTRKALEAMDFNLYTHAVDKGLDGDAWQRIKGRRLPFSIESVKENGLILCDLKDENSLTQLHKLKDNLQVIDKEL